ncbi:hypothetical protein NLI96_g7566 [Meripilus lineatus]|uniref:Conidiation protein con-6 n=1 Tax=Meripilus lineatus TaxID=2056292 RepID=A0AAD5V0Q3_9APHY|nr:hypothetical protein NLI96_g7566 [Physisporinus lineatus]
MSEHHAQNVARGHKANISNPNTSEESKERSRRILEEIEGTSDTGAFTASVGSNKSQGYSSEKATSHVAASEREAGGTDAPSKLFEEGEF